MDILHIELLLYYWRCPVSVLELDARYDWQVMALNTHHSLFPISNLCVLICITWKLLVEYELLAYWRGMGGADTHQLFSDTILCVYTASPYIQMYITIWCATTCKHDNKTHYLMTAYYTPNNSFTGKNVSFYKRKVGQLHYMLQCLFN